MNIQDEKSWKDHMELLSQEHPEPSKFYLDVACHAIEKCPYPWIHDSMLRINGGFLLSGESYDRVLSSLICDGILKPRGYLQFFIDRKRIPQIETDYALKIPEMRER